MAEEEITVPTISKLQSSVKHVYLNIHRQPKRTTQVFKSQRFTYIFSNIGLTLGIGNIIMFPYMAYRNKGAPFIYAYIILVTIIGKNLHSMEASLGQYCELGVIDSWKCFPLAKGIGGATVFIVFLVTIFYNIILSYTVLYFGQCFRKKIPWIKCEEWWGADMETCFSSVNYNVTCKDSSPDNERACWTNSTLASVQFWNNYILNKTEDGYLGKIKMDLAISYMIIWIFTYLTISKSSKSQKDIMIYSVVLPFCYMGIFLIYGTTWEGATEGYKQFFILNMEDILNVTLWRSAAEQMMLSLSLAFGSNNLFGSFYSFNSSIKSDSTMIMFMDTAFSVISGLAVFIVIGNLSTILNRDFYWLNNLNEGLIFIVLSELSYINIFPVLAAMIFYIILIFIGLDSIFVMIELMVTPILNLLQRWSISKELIIFVICTMNLIFGIPLTTQGGFYYLHKLMYSGIAPTLLLIGFLEITVLMWGYGYERFCNDIKPLLGKEVSRLIKFNWCLISPLLLIIFYGNKFHELFFHQKQHSSAHSSIFDKVLFIIPPFIIFIWAVIFVISKKGNWKEIRKKERGWGPSDNLLYGNDKVVVFD